MSRQVKKRAICYISGYDPRGARYYHSLFKEESAKQAQVNGCQVEVSSRQKSGARINHWAVNWCDQNGNSCESDYFILSYDEIIKNNWARTDLEVMVDFFKGYWGFFRTGLSIKGWKINWPIMVTFSYPPVILFCQFALIILGAILAFCLPLHWSLQSLLALAPIYPILRLSKLLDKKCNHYWIIRTMQYWTRKKYRDAPAFDSVIKDFSDHLSDLDNSDSYDEISVISHSLGCVMSVEMMAHAVKQDASLGTRRAEINMLTLGGTLPFVAFVPNNHEFRDALYTLVIEKRIDWLDFAAKVDGPSFHLIHPLSAVKEWDGNTRLPRMMPAKFFKCFSPEGYTAIKKNRLSLHFQYILAGEIAGEYDYFNMSCGIQFLRDLYPSDNSQ